MLNCKQVDSPMDQNQKLMMEGESFLDLERYRQLVGKLIYLTRPDLCFAVEVVG